MEERAASVVPTMRAIRDSVFPLADAREAFHRSGARGKRGKVVLRVADEDAR